MTVGLKFVIDGKDFDFELAGNDHDLIDHLEISICRNDMNYEIANCEHYSNRFMEPILGGNLEDELTHFGREPED